MTALSEQLHGAIVDRFHIVRLGVALLAGAAIAGGLTLFMHVLIAYSQHELDESGKANFLDFVRVKRDEVSERKVVKPQRPEQAKAPPAPPTPQSQQDANADASLNVGIPSVSSDIAVDIGDMGVGTGDGEYLPIVKVAPAYPMKAAANGFEGNCTVEYTVTTTGATKNVRIVSGKCERIFAKASIAAAKRFKYKPRVINGEPVEVPNVRNRFEYNLEQAGQQQ